MRHCVLLCLLFATVTVADVPEDWEEFKQGPGGKIEDKSGSWYAISVAKGGMVGIRRDIPDNPPFSAIYVMVPEVEQSGYTVGVFINTADGAIVKVERFVGNGKQKARFTALAGKRQFGQREVDLPSGTVELQLIRAEDRFTARAKGRKNIEIASLTWPELKNTGRIGVLVNNQDAASMVSVRVGSISFHNRFTFFRKALELRLEGKPEAAKEAYDEALTIWENDILAYRFLRSWAVDFGTFEQQKTYCEKLLALEPESAGNKQWLADALLKHNEDLPRAIQLAEEATQVFPNKSTFVGTMALAYSRAGRHKEAIAAGEQAIKLHMADDENVEFFNIAFTTLAEAYTASEQPEKAKDVWQRLVDRAQKTEKLQSSYEFFRVLLARAYAQLGDKEQTRKNAEEAVRLARDRSKLQFDHIQLFEDVGDVYVVIGDNETALNAYLEARKLAQQFSDTKAQERLKPKIVKVLQ